LEGALVFLGQQTDVPAKPYGVYGISMGAAVGLMVAGRDERLGAVAADSAYANLEDTLGRHLTLMYPLPKIPFLWFIAATYRLRFGRWPNAVSPRNSAATLGRRPLLLIAGGADPRMPASEAQEIAARASGPKDVLVIRGAGHLEGYAYAPDEYVGRLIKFFSSSLGSLS
jgi:fermentation-respiration switch protein FrsA (DUF1100 family)